MKYLKQYSYIMHMHMIATPEHVTSYIHKGNFANILSVFVTL